VATAQRADSRRRGCSVCGMSTHPAGFTAPCLPTKADTPLRRLMGSRNQARRLPHQRSQERCPGEALQPPGQ
jgi:hypothetical protein